MRTLHLLDSFCGEGSAVTTELVRVITLVVNLWLAKRCLLGLAEYIAPTSLTPLLKPDKSICPIVVGIVWRRLVSKTAMKGVGKDMVAYLQDFQFGVGVPGGAEAILHAMNRFVNKHHGDHSFTMLTVDFTKAFNLVNQTTMLLVVRKTCPSISPWIICWRLSHLFVYMSTTGRPFRTIVIFVGVTSACDEDKRIAWYLDYGTIVGDKVELASALKLIQAEGPAPGLILNIKKA
ncbi:hypothetical protein V2J09_001059 [Rumex salicifolius]